jgi:hypothetical protein
MRLLIAALIGGIVMFLWGSVSHMVLPVGEMGVKGPIDEDMVIFAARDGLPREGVYILPYLGNEAMQDEHKAAAYSAKAKSSPYAFVVYNPQGVDGMDMGDNLAKEFVTNTLCAAIVAFVLSLGAFGFGRRVMVAGLMGVFAWLAISVPYWNWYRFPLDFTFGSLIQQVVGWLLAGAAIAWWLGRGEKPA